MNFEVGDYIKFYKKKHINIFYGQIIEIVNKHYHFVILGANLPNMVGVRKFFLIDGPIAKYVTKIKKEDVKEGFVRESALCE